MNSSIIFVLSDMRSGSTLLDQLLGAHPGIISVGELHWLPAYVHQDRTIYDPVHELVCTCGATVQECPFWKQVAQNLGKPLDSLRLRPALINSKSGVNKLKWLTQIPAQALEHFPAAFRYRSVQQIFNGPQLARDSTALFNAVFAVSGRPLIVDSSKSPFRFRAIYDLQPAQTYALLLARDYRAVVHSKMKRGHPLEGAAIGWRKRMLQIESLTDDLPPERKYRLKYEDLCEDPSKELTRICAFLGLNFLPEMLTRRTDNIHHIGGSPSKFDPSRTVISMDTAYKQAFDPQTLARLSHLVGDVADKWGYRG